MTDRAGDRMPSPRDDELAPISDNAALRRRVERQMAKRNEFRLSFVAYVLVNAGLLVVLGSTGMLWLAGIIALGWGAGVAVHGIDTWYQTGRRAARTQARAQQAFRDAYGPNWAKKASRKQLRAVYDRAVQPVNQRKEFAMHLAAYLCVIPLLWLLFLAADVVSFPWPGLVMAGWGLGLIGHGLSIRWNDSVSNSVEREMERQRALIAETDNEPAKRKNEDWALGADGELPDALAAELERVQKQSRRQPGEA
jgi:hypothetical protein